MNNDQFFENIAGGKKYREEDDRLEEQETQEVSQEAVDMGNYEVELAKAETNVTATRGSKTRSAKRGDDGERDAKSWDEDGTEGQLTVDVYQTPDVIIVESAIAGVRPEDIDVNVTSDSIAIRGVRHREQEVSDNDYLYQECYWGRFARSIILPQEIDPEGAEVKFRNGILRVVMPKVNKRKTRKLRVLID